MQRELVEYGLTKKIRTDCGNVYLTVNFRDKKLVEIFIRLGKAGGCATAMLDTVARLVSGICQKECMSAEDIVKILKGVRCIYGVCCIDKIGEAIEEIYKNEIIKINGEV